MMSNRGIIFSFVIVTRPCLVSTLPGPDLSIRIFVKNPVFFFLQIITGNNITAEGRSPVQNSLTARVRSTEGRPSVLQVEVPARGEAIKYPMRLHRDRERVFSSQSRLRDLGPE